VDGRFVVDVTTVFGEVGRLLPLANLAFSLLLRRNPGWLAYAADRRSLYIVVTLCWCYFWVDVFFRSRDRLDESRREGIQVHSAQWHNLDDRRMSAEARRPEHVGLGKDEGVVVVRRLSDIGDPVGT